MNEKKTGRQQNMNAKIAAGKDKFPLVSLYGAKIARAELAVRGMKELQETLARNFLMRTNLHSVSGAE